MGQLTALKVRNLKVPGRYTDGGGLMLYVTADGSRRWVLRVQSSGKRRDVGLGSVADVSLAEARGQAAELRAALRAGRDPVAERKAARVEPPRIPTFREAAQQVHAEHRPSWRNPKHAAQWLTSLEAYAFPAFGEVPVSQVSGPMVRDALAEIWLTIPETARRVRQRIGTVLDWAHAKGFRDAEAPMRSVSRGLPRQPKEREHFAAMPWQEVPAFLAALRETRRAAEPIKLAFEFLVLCAARSGEIRGARWHEIELEAREWRIPGLRMKGGKPHTVPLSDQATAILARMAELRASNAADALVFPSSRAERPLSDMALTMLLRRMQAGCTAHGFRSSFRTWVAEATDFPRDVAEAALAHVVGGRVEVAYHRSDLLERRRALMAAWGSFCTAGQEE